MSVSRIMNSPWSVALPLASLTAVTLLLIVRFAVSMPEMGRVGSALGVVAGLLVAGNLAVLLRSTKTWIRALAVPGLLAAAFMLFEAAIIGLNPP
jgi:hypothetical protein